MGFRTGSVVRLDPAELAREAREQLGITYPAKASHDEGPRTDEEFYEYTSRFMGFRLDWASVCEGHTPIGRMAADAYFDRFDSASVVGSRGSGKTRGLSVLDHLNSRFRPGCFTTHVGAIERQAALGYGYMLEYLKLPHFQHDVASEPTLKRTSYGNGSEVSILPGTLTGVSGPHPQRAVLDEADFLPWEVYQQFLGMPMSKVDAAGEIIIPQQTIVTSALRTNFGVMNRIVREAKAGKARYTSCILESLQGCPTCPDAENVARGIKLDPPHCPLWEHCGGRARKARGHMPLADALHRYAEVDEQTWLIQYLCREGISQGLVVPNWSDENVTVEAEYRRDAGPTFWAWDAGFTVPFSLLWGQLLPNGDVHIFDEVYVTQRDVSEVLEYVHDRRRTEEAMFFCRDAATGVERGPYKKPARAWGDAAAPEVGHQIRKIARVEDQTCAMKILDRIMLTRYYVRDNLGRRRLKVHPRCTGLVSEMPMWHRKQNADGSFEDLPADDGQADHSCEALGRALFNIEAGGLPSGYDLIGVIGEPKEERPGWLKERLVQGGQAAPPAAPDGSHLDVLGE